MDGNETAGIVGAEYVPRGEGTGYAVSGVQPATVAEPSSRGEVADIVGAAREAGHSLVCYGGGTQMQMGFPPRKLDLVLSTRRLNRVVDYQPDDMTVTVEPGVTLAELEAVLAERGQFLPLDPPLTERATVGGTMASAVTGPWRAMYGTPRDWVIGCRVVGADGAEVRGGGQVVKNVAGYDLPKLYTGSYGTLGVITEITLKVMPRPPARGYALVELGSPPEVEALLAAVLHSDLQPSAAELVYAGDSNRSWRLLFQFLHVPEAVDWQLGRLQEIAPFSSRLPLESGDARLRENRDAPASAEFVGLIGTTSSRVADLAAAAVDLASSRGLPPLVHANAATGQLFFRASGETADAPLAESVRALAGGAGASCRFPRLPHALIGSIDPWGVVGPELRLMRGIKAALDPAGVFSPGRFAGGL